MRELIRGQAHESGLSKGRAISAFLDIRYPESARRIGGCAVGADLRVARASRSRQSYNYSGNAGVCRTICDDSLDGTVLCDYNWRQQNE
jgi:hypothetical protein